MKSKFIIGILFSFFVLLFACENRVGSSVKPLSETEKTTFSEVGQKMAQNTFAALGATLQNAVKSGGIPYALDYCKLNALPLTDSIAQAEGASIRRTSLKLRNPKNSANQREKAVLATYQNMEQNGEALKPIVQRLGPDSIAFYAPIRVNAFCLQCHGTVGQELSVENFAFIQRKYPKDEAIGFSENALRGMWSITFPIEKNQSKL